MSNPFAICGKCSFKCGESFWSWIQCPPLNWITDNLLNKIKFFQLTIFTFLLKTPQRVYGEPSILLDITGIKGLSNNMWQSRGPRGIAIVSPNKLVLVVGWPKFYVTICTIFCAILSWENSFLRCKFSSTIINPIQALFNFSNFKYFLTICWWVCD